LDHASDSKAGNVCQILISFVAGGEWDGADEERDDAARESAEAAGPPPNPLPNIRPAQRKLTFRPVLVTLPADSRGRSPPSGFFMPRERGRMQLTPERDDAARESAEAAGQFLNPTPCTLHPTPHTLHPAPYTPHPTPYTLHYTPYTLHPAPCTGQSTPDSYRENAKADRDSLTRKPRLSYKGVAISLI